MEGIEAVKEKISTLHKDNNRLLIFLAMRSGSVGNQNTNLRISDCAKHPVKEKQANRADLHLQFKIKIYLSVQNMIRFI